MSDHGYSGACMSPVDTSAELDYHSLQKAAGIYFPNGAGVGHDEFEALAAEFYATLSLDDRGDIWINRDRELLDVSLRAATWWVNSHTTPHFPRTHRMIVIGCGDGRLAEDYLVLAKAFGIREIVFNDLFDFHVTATRAIIESLFLDLGGLEIRYHAGDFSTAAFDATFDIAAAMFFVSSEIVDLSTVEALRARRAQFFLSVRRCLHPCGVFIEEVPEPNLPGFYRRLRVASEAVLAERNLFAEERANVTLTYLAKPMGGFPYHVRYMPAVERHAEELRAVGFHSLMSWNEQADVPASAGESSTRRVKRLELWSAAS